MDPCQPGLLRSSVKLPGSWVPVLDIPMQVWNVAAEWETQGCSLADSRVCSWLTPIMESDPI